MEADISFLFEDPVQDNKAMLTIEPLAPLSMVSYLPGSYYRSEKTPTKHHLCGLFENILGWHIGVKDRKEILKQMQKLFKKKYKIQVETPSTASGYQPLLHHLFEVDNPDFYQPHITYFNDLWTQLLYRDGYSHPNGTMNLSFELIPHKNLLKKNGSISNESIAKLFKDHRGSYPYFYSAPRVREFIEVHGAYCFKLDINNHLLTALQDRLRSDDLGYLGTSEGWVHTKIQVL